LPPSVQTPARRAFTLVELLVSMAVLALILVILLGAMNGISGIIQRSTSKVQEFREARTAFETITRRLSEATLNTYWGYDNPAAPKNYMRESELRFYANPNQFGKYSSASSNGNPSYPTHCIFFQAPLGYVSNTTSYGDLPNLLNTWGYYIEFSSDTDATVNLRPSFLNTAAMQAVLPPRYRYRLIEMREPSDQLTLYQYTSGLGSSGTTLNCNTYNGTQWFSTPRSTNTNHHVLAENIVALVIIPMLSPQDDPTGTALCPNYTYDSNPTVTNSNSVLNTKNQLPPVVQITMVAVDETTFRRVQKLNMPPANFTNTTLDNLFTVQGSNLYTNTAAQPGYAKDLATLETALQADRLNYRVFTTNVSIKGAKWSRAETQ